jgi:hypothetical protein
VLELRIVMNTTAFQPSIPRRRMRSCSPNGCPMQDLAAGLIKPNGRLHYLEPLVIDNCHYRVQILDRFDADYPGLRAALGAGKFITLTTAYLTRHPSDSHALRNLAINLNGFSGRSSTGPHREKDWHSTWFVSSRLKSVPAMVQPSR